MAMKRLTTRQREIIRLMITQTKDDYWFSTSDNRMEMRESLGISDITLKQHLQRMSEAGVIIRPAGVSRGAYIVNMVRVLKLTPKNENLLNMSR